jgi:hypothetical protein
MIGDIVGGSDKFIEGEDDGTVPSLNEPRGNGKILVMRPLPGSQLRVFCHDRPGWST